MAGRIVCVLLLALAVGGVVSLEGEEGRYTLSRLRRYTKRTDYCSISKKHTMCKYEGVGKRCSPRLGGGVTEAHKSVILKAHNQLRQKIARGEETRGAPGPQPPAANMRKMVWDAELATVAQRWADQCYFEHDDNRNDPRFQVGQNLLLNETTGVVAPNWKDAVQSLYDEVKIYDGTRIAPFHFSLRTGHYTQIAWADTFLVGCGYSVYRTRGNKAWTRQLYACNYGPSGNYPDSAMYQVGRACTKCPAGTSCRSETYPSLCK